MKQANWLIIEILVLFFKMLALVLFWIYFFFFFPLGYDSVTSFMLQTVCCVLFQTVRLCCGLAPCIFW